MFHMPNFHINNIQNLTEPTLFSLPYRAMRQSKPSAEFPTPPPNTYFRRVAGAKLVGHWSTSSPKKVSVEGEALRLWVPEGLDLVVPEVMIFAASIVAARYILLVSFSVGLRRLQHDRLLLRRAGPGDGRTLSFLFGA